MGEVTFIDLKVEKRNHTPPKKKKFSNQTAKADMHVGTFIKLVPCTSCCQCHMMNLSLVFGIRKYGNVDRMIMRGEECGVTLVSVGFTWSRPLHVNALATNWSEPQPCVFFLLEHSILTLLWPFNIQNK